MGVRPLAFQTIGTRRRRRGKGADPRYGGVPEWLKGTDCKSVGFAYAGSNPAPSTSQGPEGNIQKSGFLPPDLWPLTCGCSSMVEQQPSKLMTRVRFPSPAPMTT